MSHIPELRYGMAGSPAVDISNRAPIESSAFDPSIIGPGVPVSAMRSYRITPLAVNAANITASQIIAAAGAVPIAAGTGITATNITVGGVSVAVLDITGAKFARSLQIVGASGTVARSYTITGYDEYNQLVTLVITGPAGATTVETTKVWRYISSININGGTTAAITIGTGDTYGFPIAAASFDQFVGLYWNNAVITAAAGFTAADTTNPPTSATGSVRGTYKVQSASDGTKVLQAYIFLPLANAYNMNLAYGLIPA